MSERKKPIDINDKNRKPDYYTGKGNKIPVYVLKPDEKFPPRKTIKMKK